MNRISTPAKSSSAVGLALDRFFHISERESTIGKEIRGGIVTFFAMSYILILNPLILSGTDAGGNSLGTGAQIAAGTALVAGVLTILMGVVSNFPLGLAAGMGLNAMVAYLASPAGGLTFADAMGLIVIEGILILILVLTGLRESVFSAVPNQLKIAISVGIGLFITLVGLVNAKIIRPADGVPIQLGISGSFAGFPAFIFIVGLLVTLFLLLRKVRGALLIGIIVATLLGFFIEAIHKIGPFDQSKNPTGWALSIPQPTQKPLSLPDFGTLGHFSLLGSFHKISIVSVILLVFSLMLADFFDTMGTMVAIGAEGGLLDKDGNPPKTRQILIVDSLAAVAGGAAGVSSNTSYIESASGVGEGARTGLAAVVTGVLFLLSTFATPIVGMVPTEAATPALVVVGFLMVMQVSGINWKNEEFAIPAFFTIVFMPFAYSITAGIGAGFIIYTFIQIVKGKIKKIHPLMWIISILFVLYFVRGPIESLMTR